MVEDLLWGCCLDGKRAIESNRVSDSACQQRHRLALLKKNGIVRYLYYRHAARGNLRMLHEVIPTVDAVRPGVQRLTVP